MHTIARVVTIACVIELVLLALPVLIRLLPGLFILVSVACTVCGSIVAALGAIFILRLLLWRK